MPSIALEAVVIPRVPADLSAELGRHAQGGSDAKTCLEEEHLCTASHKPQATASLHGEGRSFANGTVFFLSIFDSKC